MVTTRLPKTIVKPTALGPVANTDTKGRRQNNCLVLSTLFLFQVVIAMSSGITRAWQAP